MSEPDFSGIDPLRVPEARRRVAVLDEYLALAPASEEDVRRLAASIGISRSSFFRLAQVWRLHRQPSLLVIGKRGASSRDYGIHPKAVEIMNDVIAEAAPDAKLAATTAEIRRRCAAEGVRPPSKQTIYNHARKARAAAPSVDGPPRIAVGRMWFHLPVKGKPATAMPMLLVALALPERVIVAHRISTDPDMPPSVSDLIDEVAALRTPGAEPRQILLAPDDRRVGAAALDRAGLNLTRSHGGSVQRELSRALNGQLGPLAAIYQRGMARPTTKSVLSRQDEPLPAAEIAGIIESAVDVHNAATLTPAPAFDLAPL